MKKGSTKIYITLGIILVVFAAFFLWKRYSNQYVPKTDALMEQKITETFLAPVSPEKYQPLTPKQEKEVEDAFLGPAN